MADPVPMMNAIMNKLEQSNQPLHAFMKAFPEEQVKLLGACVIAAAITNTIE